MIDDLFGDVEDNLKTKPTKNDVAWVRLCEELQIIDKVNEHGFFDIKSSQINPIRQSRLMTKFDTSEALPKIFKDNKLSILPISRGIYQISKFKAYKSFPRKTYNFSAKHPVILQELPDYVTSLSFDNIKSEAAALNAAYISGMVHDFLDDDTHVPTTSGRMGSGSFSFDIDRHKLDPLNVDVKKSQMEIDGGFEGVDSLALIEAKNLVSKDFLVRQIYYPYRFWNNKIHKPVRSIYQVYSNGIFHFYEYDFKSENKYNSLILKKYKRYRFKDKRISMQDIADVFEKASPKNVTEISFPQADKFERVISLCELLKNDGVAYQEDITEEFEFDRRQTSYYADAAIYLGLVSKSQDAIGVKYSLSTKGRKIFAKNYFSRQMSLVNLILSHSIFHKCLGLYFESGRPPSRAQVVDIMKEYGLKDVKADSTFKRRASTVSGWMNWILGVSDDI